ncbi:hypothetical protein AVEN_43737-1 [Araneus ventricosus]|uniref:Uncharacterized protein n=1 Tax=Araneus ventricosus TaxID=182803 RepID=A0A4Y2BY78_ARAVE|nr:hypothetical protein AVEN_43737-1 [Araneus ventricosus]
MAWWQFHSIPFCSPSNMQSFTTVPCHTKPITTSHSFLLPLPSLISSVKHACQTHPPPQVHIPATFMADNPYEGTESGTGRITNLPLHISPILTGLRIDAWFWLGVIRFALL